MGRFWIDVTLLMFSLASSRASVWQTAVIEGQTVLCLSQTPRQNSDPRLDGRHHPPTCWFSGPAFLHIEMRYLCGSNLFSGETALLCH